MAFPDSILDDPAFDEFFGFVAVFTGTRRESGSAAARALNVTVACSVTGGEISDITSGGIAPAIGREYTVTIRRADWPDHKPPQSGDVITIDNFPAMAVRVVLPDGAAGWALKCHTTGAAE